MLFAFLPFMIHDFFPRLNSEELGEREMLIESNYDLKCILVA